MAQTSDDVSTIAARLVRLTVRDVADAVYHPHDNRLPYLVRDIRTVAASALRQDETPRRGWFGRLVNHG